MLILMAAMLPLMAVVGLIVVVGKAIEAVSRWFS